MLNTIDVKNLEKRNSPIPRKKRDKEELSEVSYETETNEEANRSIPKRKMSVV